MKIALALESFDPHRGSIAASACQLAQGLLRLNHDVHVVAPHFSEAGLEIAITPHRIRAHRCAFRRARAAEAELRLLRADVIHDMGLTWHADVFASQVGSPAGLWERQLAAAAWWSRPFKRLTLRLNARRRRQSELVCRQLAQSDSIVVAPSELVASDYRSFHGVSSDRIRIVPHGVDIKRFTPHIRKLRRESTRRKLAVEPKDLLLLSVANDLAIPSWASSFGALRRLLARQLPVQLVVVGGERGGAVRKLAHRFGIGKYVTEVDSISDLTAYYAASDIFLMPARYEAGSLSILEAAACGLPSITTRHNGAADLLTDGADSYVLPRDSAADLAERIDLLRDPSRRERMGLAARRMAMNHTLERHVGRILQIYDEVVARRAEADSDGRGILPMPEHVAARRAA